MFEFLKLLHEDFDLHTIRYGASATGIECPVEIRVKRGRYWVMAHYPAQMLEDKRMNGGIILYLKAQLDYEEEKHEQEAE